MKKKLHTESSWIILAMISLRLLYKKHKQQKQKKYEWDYFGLRSFCTAKETNQYNIKAIYRMGRTCLLNI